LQSFRLYRGEALLISTRKRVERKSILELPDEPAGVNFHCSQFGFQSVSQGGFPVSRIHDYFLY
jgi:hypothetical protein